MTVVTFAEAMNLGLEHLANNRLAEAEAICHKLLKSNPDFSDALHLLGLVALRVGQAEKAARLLTRAAQGDPTNEMLLTRLALAWRQARHFTEAVAISRQVAALDPGNPEGWFGLAEALREWQHWNEAITAYHRALLLSPGHPEIEGGLALARLGQGHREAAWTLAQQVLARAPAAVLARRVLKQIETGPGATNTSVTAMAVPTTAGGATTEDAHISGDATAEPVPHPAPVPVIAGIDIKTAPGIIPDTVLSDTIPADPIVPDAIGSGPAPLAAGLPPETPASTLVSAPGTAAPGTAADGILPIPPTPDDLPDTPLTAAERLPLARHAVARYPLDGSAHHTLAQVLEELAAHAEAVSCLRRVLELLDGSDTAVLVDSRLRLARGLRQLRRLDEAADAFRLALRDPRDAEDAAMVWREYGDLQLELGRAESAVEAFRQALDRYPGAAHVDLGRAWQALGRLDEAESACRQALGITADNATAHTVLGSVLHLQGRLDEAITSLRRALDIAPANPVALSAWLYALNRQPGLSERALIEAHHRYQTQIGIPAASRHRPHTNVADRQRRLRIGYLGPVFCTHPVASFLEPLFLYHDRRQVQIFCYAEVPRPDPVTARLRGRADSWYDTAGRTDATVAEAIRADEIDILVDLAGHSPGNRLPVLALKPAPVQMSWLGYSNTTGLEAVDYRLTDTLADPPQDHGAAQGDARQSGSETLLRLAGGFHCWQPPQDAPEPASPPADAPPVFGYFGQLAKLTPDVLALWACVLARVPESRLAVKARPLDEASVRQRFLALAEEQGLPADRIDLLPWTASAQAHLADYNRIAVALDPFPASAAVTTCEALWMGVPVVTWRGDRHATRIAASLLIQANLPDFVALSLDAYVETAVDLAGSGDYRDWLRHKLRTRLRLSPLCDARPFVRTLETAYRAVWQHWCNAVTPPPIRDLLRLV